MQNSTRSGSGPIKDTETHSLALITRVPRISQAQWQTLNWPIKWLIMVRAVVLVMTLNSVLVGVLLAMDHSSLPWDRVVALAVGLVMAHATNNLVNDWVDHRMGVDQGNYFRRQYGTQVLEDGFIKPAEFWLVTIATGCIALTCAGYLIVMVPLGNVVFYLTLLGAIFVLFYTWPLKHFALGEITVLLVWGPLITGGAYFVLTETVNVRVLLISLVAGIGPTLVILGKHMDKYTQDLDANIRTLPVVVGLLKSRWVCSALLGIQWGILGWLMGFYDSYFLVCCLVGFHPAWQLNGLLFRDRPAEKPQAYPENVWPLWYAAAAFGYARVFGFILLLGLTLEAAF